MPDICFNCEQKKTYLQFLRHLIFQFGIVCLCFLTASHKVSGLILLDDGSSYSFMSIMIFFLQNLSKCTRQSACSRIGRHISILRSTYNRIVSQPLPCCVRRRGGGAACSATPLAARCEAATMAAAAAYRCRLECATYIYAQAAKFILHLERQYGREVQQQCYH